MEPTRFRGDDDPQEAGEWVTSVEEAFETIKCRNDRKVCFGAHLLKGPAKEWWQTTKDTLCHPILWRRFKRAFETRFFPQAYRDQRVEQFMHLRQEEMTVEEYATRFIELERFAPEMVSSEYFRAKKFESGLRVAIVDHVVPQQHIVFQDVLETALAMERHLIRPHHQLNKDGRKKDLPASTNLGGKPSGQTQGKQNRGQDHINSQIMLRCDNCGKKHATEEC